MCFGLVAWCSVPVDTEITFFQPSKHVMSGCIVSYMKWLNGMWHSVAQHYVWPWELRRKLKGLCHTHGGLNPWLWGQCWTQMWHQFQAGFSIHVILFWWKSTALLYSSDDCLLLMSLATSSVLQKPKNKWKHHFTSVTKHIRHNISLLTEAALL